MKKQAKQTKDISKLQLILTVLFTSCLLISNVITAKQVLLPFDIVMTGAVFVFPLTYVLSDLFSEVYGYKWSRFTCYLAFAMNLLMVIAFTAVINMPAPDSWQLQEAFQATLGSTPKVLFASLLGFMVGDLVNDKIFKRYKDKHPNDHKGFGFRAILSSLCGELTDSLIFIPIVFCGTMPTKVLITMMLTQVLIKTAYEVLILPVTRVIVKIVSTYESKDDVTMR